MQVENIPTWLADAWDITEGAAQMVLSISVILLVMLPTFYLARGKRAVAIELVLLFLCECLLVGIGWLPFWVLIATVCVLALAVATLGTNAVVGD